MFPHYSWAALSLIRSIGFIGVNGSLISISTKTFSRAAEKMFLGRLKFDIWELFTVVLDSLFLRYNISFSWLKNTFSSFYKEKINR